MELLYKVIMKDGTEYLGFIRGVIGSEFHIKVWSLDNLRFEFHRLKMKDVKHIRRLCV
jgi:hypothetical protein